MSTDDEVTRLLAKLSEGKEEVEENLPALMYDELRSLARLYMRRERPGHTLQATALAHEAYLLFKVKQDKIWESRGHFMRLAAKAMRRILIDHARRKRLAARRVKADGLSYIKLPVFTEESMVDLLALDEAMNDLAREDPQAAQVVEFRFFGGLSVAETAEILDISTRTVKREWRAAKAWLRKEIYRGENR